AYADLRALLPSPTRRSSDLRTSDVDVAARFWGEALGRPVDLKHPGSRGTYRMLATPPDEPIVQIQRVSHESRVHIDIETDDIPRSEEHTSELQSLTNLVCRL